MLCWVAIEMIVLPSTSNTTGCRRLHTQNIIPCLRHRPEIPPLKCTEKYGKLLWTLTILSKKKKKLTVRHGLGTNGRERHVETQWLVWSMDWDPDESYRRIYQGRWQPSMIRQRIDHRQTWSCTMQQQTWRCPRKEPWWTWCVENEHTWRQGTNIK